MPIGGKNAPALFRRMMNTIFNSIGSQTLAIYLDDLCLHSKTYEDNPQTILEVLQILRYNKE